MLGPIKIPFKKELTTEKIIIRHEKLIPIERLIRKGLTITVGLANHQTETQDQWETQHIQDQTCLDLVEDQVQNHQDPEVEGLHIVARGNILN